MGYQVSILTIEVSTNVKALLAGSCKTECNNYMLFPHTSNCTAAFVTDCDIAFMQRQHHCCLQMVSTVSEGEYISFFR